MFKNIILGIIPISPHYRDKYINFIDGRSRRVINDDVYTENHHIIPISMGKEYKYSRWNRQRTLDKKRCTGVSRGIAQFRKETFYEQAAVAIKDKTWPFGKPRWFSEQQQLWLLDDMLNRGMGNRWTCHRKLTNKTMD